MKDGDYMTVTHDLRAKPNAVKVLGGNVQAATYPLDPVTGVHGDWNWNNTTGEPGSLTYLGKKCWSFFG